MTDGILVKEVDELQSSLKRTAAQVVHVYRTQKSKARLLSSPYIARHARHISTSVVRPLQLEIERHSYLCDVIEAKLYRAIATLRRDIEREKERIKKRDLETSQKQESVSLGAPPISDSGGPSGSDLPTQFPPGIRPGMGLAGPVAGAQSRRAHPVSLSSLRTPRHGAPFPLKLDLSAAALRPNEPLIPSLFSPVTLAPQTGRPLPSGVETESLPFSDFGGALGDSDSVPGLGPIVDLTVGGEGSGRNNSVQGTAQHNDLADSADMESLFGEVNSAIDIAGSSLPLTSSHPVMETQVDVSSLFSPEPVRQDDQVPGLAQDMLHSSAGALLHQAPSQGDTSRVVSSADAARVGLGEASKANESSVGQQSLGGEYDLGMDFQPFSPSMFGGFDEGEVPGLGKDFNVPQLEDLLKGHGEDGGSKG